MSKSNKKSTDRLKDSCRHKKLRTDRHNVKELLKRGFYEDVEDIEDEITLREDEKKEK